LTLSIVRAQTVLPLPTFRLRFDEGDPPPGLSREETAEDLPTHRWHESHGRRTGPAEGCPPKMRAMQRMSPTTRRAAGAFALAVYIGIIVLANWLITRFGAVDVGFGLMAPAAVYAAGAAFPARHRVQTRPRTGR